MNNIYKDYRGMPCVSREINPDNWTWVYLYHNKNAKKNKQQYDTMENNVKMLQEKNQKYQEDIDATFEKFYKNANLSNGENSNVNINDCVFDDVKGILTMRNKFNKCVKLVEENKLKIENFITLMDALKEDGFDEFVKVSSNDMVYAYDMQNYVRLHPEQFGNNKK